MPALTSSLSYVAGDDVLIRFTVTDQDDVAANITGTTPRFAIVNAVTGVAVVGTETSPATAVATITDGPNGVFTVAIDDEDTEDLRGTYRYQAELTDVSGGVSTVATGFIDFERSHV